ncbi:hypothetical protein Tco_0409430 [Tanacetum coccineum]
MAVKALAYTANISLILASHWAVAPEVAGVPTLKANNGHLYFPLGLGFVVLTLLLLLGALPNSAIIPSCHIPEVWLSSPFGLAALLQNQMTPSSIMACIVALVTDSGGSRVLTCVEFYLCSNWWGSCGDWP